MLCLCTYRQDPVDYAGQDDGLDGTTGSQDSMKHEAVSSAFNDAYISESLKGLTSQISEGAPNINGSPVQEISKKDHYVPLVRKTSDVTNDSGRGSAMDNQHNSDQEDVPNSTGEGGNGTEVRRQSIIDATGHLAVPSPSDNFIRNNLDNAATESNLSVSGVDAQLKSNCSCQSMSSSGQRTPSPMNLSATNSPGTTASDSPGQSPGNSPCLTPKHLPRPIPAHPIIPGSLSSSIRAKHAPKIVYSHSEDKLTTSSHENRAIIPSLPYSPYGSPSGSPRLRRQPTRETRSLSISEDGDGYKQLNQYRLKDEIGKVGLIPEYYIIVYLIQSLKCFVYLPSYIATYLATYLPTYLPTYLSIYLSIYPSKCKFIVAGLTIFCCINYILLATALVHRLTML